MACLCMSYRLSFYLHIDDSTWDYLPRSQLIAVPNITCSHFSWFSKGFNFLFVNTIITDNEITMISMLIITTMMTSKKLSENCSNKNSRNGDIQLSQVSLLLDSLCSHLCITQNHKTKTIVDIAITSPNKIKAGVNICNTELVIMNALFLTKSW